MTTRKHTPHARMAQAARLLHGHAHLLQERGEAAFIVHRSELGRRQQNFLAAVRRLLKDQAHARWYHSPWPRGAPSNVLVITLAPPPGDGQARCVPRFLWPPWHGRGHACDTPARAGGQPVAGS